MMNYKEKSDTALHLKSIAIESSLSAIVLESSTDIILSFSQSYDILTLNKNGQRQLFDLTNINFIIGCNLLSFIPVNLKKKWQKRLSKALSGESFILEDVLNPSHKERLFEFSFYPIWESEKVTGASIIARNISERKHKDTTNAARLHLIRFGINHSIKDFLEELISTAKLVTNSQKGYFFVSNPDLNRNEPFRHFLHSNPSTPLSVQESNKKILNDCIKRKRPTIKDRISLYRRKKIKNDHLLREMGVPVIRGKEIVAILWVANKTYEYSQYDIHAIQQIADLAWDTITRKNAEEMILQEKKRANNILEGTNAGTWEWDIESGKGIINQRWAEITGYTKKELEPLSFYAWRTSIHPDDAKMVENVFLKHLNNDIEYYDVEFRQKHKNGSWIWVNSRGKVTEWSKDGTPSKMTGTQTDISERKKAEEELRESEMRFKQLANFTFEGIIIHEDEVIQNVNTALQKISGYREDELIGINFIEKLFPKHQQKIILQNMKSGRVNKQEIELIRKDFHKIPVEISSKEISSFEKKRKVVSIRDISEQKEIQQKLLNTIIQTEEKERKRIAQELHDGLGPVLSMVKLYTQTYLNSNNEKLKEKIKGQLLSGINDSLEQVSSISNNLSPHVLNDFGLETAIWKFIDKALKISNLTFSFQYDFQGNLKKDIEITLYRVTIELINNTIKHANATKIGLSIYSKTKDSIYLTYTDNGNGFDFEKFKQLNGGMGLFNIVNRIKSLNGSFKFERLEKGIQYEIAIPNNQ